MRNFFKVLFSKQEGSKIGRKKKAVAFVDFEHWYISLDRMYRDRPDIKAFRDELTDRYEIIDIVFFGDFSNPSLRQEIINIRQVTNTIIDTQNTSTAFEKDFTTPYVIPGCQSIYAQYAILAKDTATRDKVIAHLTEKKIPNMIYYPTPQHALPVFADEPAYGEKFTNADDYCARTLSLPMHPYMSAEDQKAVIDAVLEAL